MCVADYYKISVSQMVSSTRISNVSTARHIAMYLIRNLLDIPFMKIGYEFGGRDHSTVISACDKVERLLKKDPNFKQAIEDIKVVKIKFKYITKYIKINKRIMLNISNYYIIKRKKKERKKGGLTAF